MPFKGFGINVDGVCLDGKLDGLARNLEYFMGLGFSYIEIHTGEGRLVPRQMEKIRQLLAQFPLNYTVHCPRPLDLMDIKNLARQKLIFIDNLEFAASINAEVLVYHGGRYVPEEALRQGGKAPDEQVIYQLHQQEIKTLQELAQKAEHLGVTIGVENLRPYAGAIHFTYAYLLSHLVEQVVAVAHPRVGITLDIGHAYLSASYFNLDFLETVAKTVPYVVHVHVHDNFGRVIGYLEQKESESSKEKRIEVKTAGLGDLHLPIGKGVISYDQVFRLLANSSIVVMHEILGGEEEYAREALEYGRRLIDILSN